VVSGLAKGIDAAAHSGLVDVSGVGVAVLGSGPDVVYPAANRSLHDALLDAGGGVVTEYPPGTPPHGWRFPPRNRIIAGLASAVVVVEAAEVGGALITAEAAVRQGRHVFAVPGDVDRPSSRGCNLLIRDGAIPVLDPDDLTQGLSLVLGPPTDSPEVRGGSLPAEAETLMAAVGVSGCTLEEAAEATGMDAPSLMRAVAHLEVAGSVCRDGDRLVPGR
jgi:DNA processing protein